MCTLLFKLTTYNSILYDIKKILGSKRFAGSPPWRKQAKSLHIAKWHYCAFHWPNLAKPSYTTLYDIFMCDMIDGFEDLQRCRLLYNIRLKSKLSHSRYCLRQPSRACSTPEIRHGEPSQFVCRIVWWYPHTATRGNQMRGSSKTSIQS